jgi:X-Pro dipeptidyl-peptidase
MVTRGWLDPQNRHRIDRSRRIRQRRQYSFRWDLQPDDYVSHAGHRIGLVVVSTDHDHTMRPDPGTELTLDPAARRGPTPDRRRRGRDRLLTGVYDQTGPGG